ncbi:type VI secretion system ATPase TssH [Vineibacter terrae]|uniref:type VI secretion system ATPase TssH n=1 Tax=Vineibacter terrae TaxID=2586908 RepID=UPI002E37F8F2|nr:type VI secretion system ATPase TssH [Vineibacter terrae]HEX2891263.1 type VI secretion system ATPase TssH [Vineibacter terrae]
MAVDLKSLVGKLNAPCRKALEDAAGLTMSRTHYNVEVEHWLLKLIEIKDGDIAKILARYEADLGRLSGELNRAIERFKTGNGRPPGLSPQVVSLARDAWIFASVNRQAHEVRSGHILVAILTDEAMSIAARNASAQLAKIPVETLARDFDQATDGSSEARAAAAVSDVQAGAAAAGAAPRKGPSGALDLYTTDLTARAKAGKLDPVLGRDAEIRQCIDILLRRRQNNPILTGEAGVGKTSVVDGLALKIAADDVPDKLKGCAIRVLDLGLLQAGAGMKGEFENRLNGVLQDVKASPQPIIMFIDEAHMMIGAGGAAGQGDAANLLKPALARGELRTIAATTWAEYKKYFERDPALTRRFQVVKVEEPDERNGIEMLRGVATVMEQHHKVRVLDEAVQEAVRLSNRYIAGRQLPDKAISVLDTACARVAMAQASTPAAVEDLRRQIELLDVRLGILRREQQAGGDHATDIAEGDLQAANLREELKALEARWAKEKVLVDEVTQLRADLEGELNEDERPAKKAALDAKWSELKTLQGETPLVMPLVDGQATAAIVADWTGIPVGRMMGDQIRTVLNLKDKMAERVIGQDHALELIAKGMRTARARMQDPRKPLGVFMLAGTSGTGKTETALTLAEQMYGGDQALTIINMSEFKEEHKVSMLVGSPPGYVGYGEGGVLTEAVRRHPYSVVLLDEVEKAHPGVQDVFYQVFDKGMLRDGEGRDIDFKNTVIILTSNAGTDLIAKLCADPDTRPNPDALNEALHPELLKTFKPAFLGRITIVPYYPLDEATIKKIVRLQLGRVVKRVAENYKAPMTYADDMVDTIAARCTEVASGARNIEQIIQRTLLPELSSNFLGALADGKVIHKVHVGVDKAGQFEYMIE